MTINLCTCFKKIINVPHSVVYYTGNKMFVLNNRCVAGNVYNITRNEIYSKSSILEMSDLSENHIKRNKIVRLRNFLRAAAETRS